MLHKKLVGAVLLTLLVGGQPAWAQDAWAQVRAEQVALLGGMMGVYEGSIGGKYPIRLVLRPGAADTLVVGSYYYLSKGKPLALTGYTRASLPTQALELRELLPTDTVATGWFSIGVGREPELLGQWYNASGTALYPLTLRRVNGAIRPAATVARITPKTYLKSFQIPVVTVADAGVTRLLADRFSLENLTGGTLAGLRQQLQDHSGIQELHYTVNYNTRGLLSLTSEAEGIGASVWHSHQTYNLDLATGFAIQVADEIRPELLPQFLALGQKKLRAITKAYVPTQEGFLAEEDKQGVLSQQFSEGSAEEYRIEPDGLVFDHPVTYDGLSNLVWKVLEGNFEVKFTYAELRPFLKPDSPLRRLLPR